MGYAFPLFATINLPLKCFIYKLNRFIEIYWNYTNNAFFPSQSLRSQFCKHFYSRVAYYCSLVVFIMYENNFNITWKKICFVCFFSSHRTKMNENNMSDTILWIPYLMFPPWLKSQTVSNDSSSIIIEFTTLSLLAQSQQ